MTQSTKVGTTSFVTQVFIQDSASTTGAGKTGLAYNTASLTCYYKKSDGTASVSVTLANITTLGTFVSGGFKEIDATNMPGWYEFHPPNASISSGTKTVFTLQGASGMVTTPYPILLTAVDPQDATRGGMSALPNANAGANGGLPLSVDANGRVDVGEWLGNAVTWQSTAGRPAVAVTHWNELAIGSPVTIGGNNYPVMVAFKAYDSVALDYDYLLPASGGGLDAAGVRAAVGLASANLDTQLGTIDTVVDAIKAKTDNLPTDPADASDISSAFGTVNSTLATIAGYIDTEIGTLQTSVNDLPTNSELTTALSGLATASALSTVEGKVDTVDTVVDQILADTGTDGVVVAAGSKTGYKLASDGLDTVSVTAPTGAATNFREMLVQVWRRFFKKTVKNASTIKTFADDGTTEITSQTYTSSGGTDTVNSA